LNRSLRALHVFPLFGSDLTNGSERYEYMLTRKLVERGVRVDVLTTRSKRLRPTSAFSLAWVSDDGPVAQHADGIHIWRFPATFSLLARVGHACSRLIFRRWKKEEARHGTMMKGSRHLVDHYYMRALERPSVYDWMTVLGHGPHSLSLLGRLIRTIRDYDVILVGFMPFALIWQVTHLARLFKKPVVVLALFHPEDIHHHFSIYYRCFARADAILAQTSYSAALFGRLFPQSRPIQVGAGVEHEIFTDGHVDGTRFRTKYGLLGKKVILFVGRKESSKRYDLAIEAIDLIAQEDVRLVMIGGDADGKPISSPHVTYLGTVSREDLVDAYDACAVFVLPSEHESFGIVFLEAWMRRKPVIGNAFCQSVASVIRDGEDGYLCSTAKGIAERIQRLISDVPLAEKLGAAGYQKVMEHHTWDAVGGKVHDLYSRICTTR